MVFYCPNCDSILASGRCQACGWKTGDSVTRNFAVNPLDHGKHYPGYEAQVDNPPPDDPPGGGLANVVPSDQEKVAQLIAKFPQPTAKVQ